MHVLPQSKSDDLKAEYFSTFFLPFSVVWNCLVLDVDVKPEYKTTTYTEHHKFINGFGVKTKRFQDSLCMSNFNYILPWSKYISARYTNTEAGFVLYDYKDMINSVEIEFHTRSEALEKVLIKLGRIPLF